MLFLEESLACIRFSPLHDKSPRHASWTRVIVTAPDRFQTRAFPTRPAPQPERCIGNADTVTSQSAETRQGAAGPRPRWGTRSCPASRLWGASRYGGRPLTATGVEPGPALILFSPSPRLSGRRAKPGSSAVCFVPAREALSSLGPRPLLTKPPLGLHPSGLNTAPKPLARTSSEPRYSLCLSPVCQLRSAPTFVCRCSWWSPHERRFLNVCPANG